MSPEFKAKFVKALRSGKYQQTRGALRRNNGFCCLGVACEVAGYARSKAAVGVYFEGDDTFEADLAGTALLHEFTPNEKYFGTEDEVQTLLAKANDAGVTFDEIADWIEEVL